MIASVTELHLKNFWSYLRFIPHAVRSRNQAVKAKGLVSISFSSQGIFVQRTMTLWNSKEEMMDYVRTGAHLEAMKIFGKIANTSYTTHLEVETPPSWEQAIELLRTKGKRIG